MATSMCPPQELPVEPGSAPTAWGSAHRAIADLARWAPKPAALRRLVGLVPHERRLIVTGDLNFALVVATNAVLDRLGSPRGCGDWSRWGREQIGRVEWHESASIVILIGQAPVLRDRVAFTLPASGLLVAVAGERLGWTTLRAMRVGVPGGVTVRVVVRRRPVSDRVDWFVYPDATVAGDGARGRAEVDGVPGALRAGMGS